MSYPKGNDGRIYWAVPDIGDEEIDNVLESISARWVGSNGPAVNCLQDSWCERMEVDYALAVNNGTSALLVALQAIREIIGTAPRVGVPTYTFIASANAGAEIGDHISLIDCDPQTWNIVRPDVPWGLDVLMPVDVGGLPCDYDKLDMPNVITLADSAESAGATYKDKPVGSQCDIHTFSLHRAKILACGEGGMVTTNNKDVFDVMKSIANHGYAASSNSETWDYSHERRGFNYRMTELEAAIALAQLNKLDKYIQERRYKASVYRERLAPYCEFQADPDNTHPYFFFGAKIKKDTKWFCREMDKRNIEVKTWKAVHRQKPYLKSDDLWPVASELSDSVVLLPIGNTLTGDDVEYVADVAGELLCQ
jgi:perosamine synthetase